MTVLDQLSILGIPHDADGSGYYRYYLPYQHLARGTHHRILLPAPGEKYFPEPDQLEEIDVIVGQRFVGPGQLLWEKWKATGKVKLVYEVDDDILQPDTWSGLAHTFDPSIQESFEACIRMSDLVTVSTPTLADQMRRLNPNVRVLPNHIDADMLYVDRPRRDRLTVGWSGGMSHLGDWMAVKDPVGSVLRANPDVDMHFIGIDYSPVLELGRDCRYTPWQTDVWGYIKACDFDIGLAPLSDTPFNHSKSHIRALEYMALGIPVIAADLPPYRDLVVDGVTGYLASTPEAWAKRLTDLIADADAREELGAAGKQVARDWVIQSGWTHWRDAYEEVTGWRR